MRNAPLRPMSLWRLEWLRLLRTHRLVALVAVYAFFGLTAAPLTRYVNELIDRFGGGQVQLVGPEPTAADAVANYASNAAQLGLLVFTLVAGAALTVDAHRETAVFLRTRVADPARLLLPRYVVPWAAGSAGFTLGVACTWYGTALLLGPLPAGSVVLGTVLVWLYLAFLGAVVAVVGTRSSSTVVTTAVSLGVALVLGIVGGIGDLGRWLPSHLVGALTDLTTTGSAADYVTSALVTLAVTGALLGVAVRLSGRREL
jgi:ABC-2 type transport system permease protein